MTERKRHLDAAQSSLQEIITSGHNYSIAAALNDVGDLDEIRQEAEAHLAAYLDHMGLAGATAAKLKP